MSGNYYQNKYSGNKGNGYSNKSKKKSQEAKTLTTLAAVGLLAFGSESLYTANNNQQTQYQIKAEETIKPEIVDLEELKNEQLKENADKYTANEFFNMISHIPNEDMCEYQNEIDGTYIELTGEVMNCRTNNYLYDDHITLGSTYPDNLVASYGLAYFDFTDEEERKELKNIETGDIVTVVGRYSKLDDAFYDCDLVSYEKGDGSYDIDYSKAMAPLEHLK